MLHLAVITIGKQRVDDHFFFFYRLTVLKRSKRTFNIYISIFTTSLIPFKVFAILTFYIEKNSLLILDCANQA